MTHPFSDLPNLSACLEDRIKDGFHDLAEPQQKAWIGALGRGLARIIPDEEKEVEHIQKHALRLAQTVWQPVQFLEVEPYIDGTPAGTTRKVDALWKDQKLYVKGGQIPKLFKSVAQELARPFDRQDITEAIKACIERSAEFVTEYLEENFKLNPLEAFKLTKDGNATQTNETTETHLGGGEGIHSSNEASKQQYFDPVDGGKAEKRDATLTSDENEDEGMEPRITAQKPHTDHPPQPKFIELYAEAMGYERVGESDRFGHPDGSSLQKSGGQLFPWEKYSTDGVLMQSYWLKQHCLEKQSLELDTEIWLLCQNHPDKYTLILSDSEGHPIEFTGRMLIEMVQAEKLKLDPAKYRLAYDKKHG